MWEQQFGELQFSPTDRIQKINGVVPEEFLTKFADESSYSSKSAHSRLNFELGGNFYQKRLDLYNLPSV